MLSVIIPTENEEENIAVCLKTLQSQNLHMDEYEIIVVDGKSNDRTREIASMYADRVIVQSSPGIGGARKDGAEAANGDMLVFTDADTFYQKNWLEIISENLDDYSLSTGPVMFYDGNIRSDFLQLWRKTYSFLRVFNFYWLIGSNIAIRSDMYKKIGGHSDISLLEDFDLSVKAFKIREHLCKYDRDQIVWTSSRRLNSLLSYFLLYTYGQYYYWTGDHANLLKYPSFDQMKLVNIFRNV